VELVAEAADYTVASEPETVLAPSSRKADAGLPLAAQPNTNESVPDIEAAHIFGVRSIFVVLNTPVAVTSSFVALTADAGGNYLLAASLAAPGAPDESFSAQSCSPSAEKIDPDSGAAQEREQPEPSPALSWRPPSFRP